MLPPQCQMGQSDSWIAVDSHSVDWEFPSACQQIIFTTWPGNCGMTGFRPTKKRTWDVEAITRLLPNQVWDSSPSTHTTASSSTGQQEGYFYYSYDSISLSYTYTIVMCLSPSSHDTWLDRLGGDAKAEHCAGKTREAPDVSSIEGDI
jgi:hypothetical protein